MRFLIILLLTVIPCAAQHFAIEGIASVAFRVTGLKASLPFYRDLLGLPVAFELNDDQGNVRSIFLQVNTEQYLELIPDLPATENKRLDEIRFEADNLHQLPHLPFSTPSTQSRDGTRMIHFVSPEEQSLAFVEYLPASKERQKQLMPSHRISDHLWHVGIVVPREALPDALAFYHGLLGFEEFWRGGPEGATTAWVNMRIQGKRQDYVELMLSDGVPDRQRLGSMQHVCLQVPDIQSAFALVKQRDASHTQSQKPRVGRNGKWQLNLFDPDGTRIELMETDKAKPQP